MAVAFAFEIEELTGSKRKVTLRGRALPYRPVEWAGTMRTTTTWYPGNPEATVQVLGSEEDPTSIRGMWKDRFLPGQVTTSGFGYDETSQPITTAEQLVQLMHEIRTAGNALRVQWGPEARHGILTSFAANYQRIEDVEFEATFEWYKREEVNVKRAAPEPAEDIDSLLNAINSFVDDVVAIPQGIEDEILESIDDFREKTGRIINNIRKVQGALETPANVLNAVSTAAEDIRISAEASLSALLDVPYTTKIAGDRLLDVLSLEVWRRSAGRTLSRTRAVSLRRSRRLERLVKPSGLKVVVIPSGANLRTIALTEYGDADAWTLIADANGLAGSTVDAGQSIVIPPPPAAQGGRFGNISS